MPTSPEPDEPDSWSYADSRSVEGRLQRGLGIGALQALTAPDGAALVMACLRRDHRWWWFIDQRATYLARLVRDLGIERSALGTLLREVEHQDGNALELTTDVLTALAAAGDGEALTALTGYVDRGLRWVHVLQRMAAELPPGLWSDLHEQALRRLPAEPDGDFAPYGEPWKSWLPRPADGPPPAGPDRPYADTDTKTYADADADPDADDMLPAAPGEEQDVPALVAEGRRLVASGEWCGLDRIADDLARHGPAAAAALPFLRGVVRRTPHSYERTAALRAWLAVDRADCEPRLVPCVWDCEEEVRLLAVREAPLRTPVPEWLALLRDDPLESAEVRGAAADRLGSAGIVCGKSVDTD